MLYWKSGLNYREIADQLNISEKTVATQVHRSLDFLRDKLGIIALSLIHILSLGARLENIVMLDSKGVISKARTDLNEQKRFFATDRTDIHTLEEAIKGADVFLRCV